MAFAAGLQYLSLVLPIFTMLLPITTSTIAIIIHFINLYNVNNDNLL